MKKFFNKIKKCFSAVHSTVTFVKKRTTNLRIFIFFDLIWCAIRYGISLREYKIFEFYRIGSYKRSTYLSIKEYNRYKKKLYSTEILSILNNKDLLFTRLKKHLNREIINVNDMSFKDFERFALANKNLLARSKNKSFLSSYKIYRLKDFRSHAFMHDKIKSDNNIIVEKEFNNDPLLSRISDGLVTIIIITLHDRGRTKIVSSCIKFKDGDNIVNGYIDVKNLCIKGHLRDNNNRIYNLDIDGYRIPSLEKAFILVHKCAGELSEIREIEWSVCLNENGEAYLVDANVSEDLIFEQTPEYLNNRVGLRYYYKNYLSRIKRW